MKLETVKCVNMWVNPSYVLKPCGWVSARDGKMNPKPQSLCWTSWITLLQNSASECVLVCTHYMSDYTGSFIRRSTCCQLEADWRPSLIWQVVLAPTCVFKTQQTIAQYGFMRRVFASLFVCMATSGKPRSKVCNHFDLISPSKASTVLVWKFTLPGLHIILKCVFTLRCWKITWVSCCHCFTPFRTQRLLWLYNSTRRRYVSQKHQRSKSVSVQFEGKLQSFMRLHAPISSVCSTYGRWSCPCRLWGREQRPGGLDNCLSGPS